MSTDTKPQMSSIVVWLICAIAAIGFAFDIYELLMLPLVIKPALAELGGLGENGAPLLTPGSAPYLAWARTLFFLPAIVGGIFGLVGGYLTDRLGRRRVLTWSILLYAFSAVGAGMSTTLYQLLIFRCLVFVGVCVEFVAAVAWLAELFTEPKQRERVLGYTQAFSSIGGLMVGVAAVLAAKLAQAEMLPPIYGAHTAWRYTLISGVIPAIPLIVIRPFLPESPVWERKRAAGQLKRPSIAELFGPGLAKTTIVTTLMFASSYGIAFGAIQQLPQILSRHAGVMAESAAKVEQARNELATAESSSDATTGEQPALDEAGLAKQKQATEAKFKKLGANATDEAVARVTIWQEFGGLFGRFALAILAVRIISRRALIRVFQVPALIFVPVLFWWISTETTNAESLTWIRYGIFIAGFLTVAQFSFWGNYIPRVFPMHLRGTGESFAANIGGRILGTAAAWLTLTFSQASPPSAAKIALVAAIVAGSYCLVGFLLSFQLPEPNATEED